jgi:hypothetical protein
MKRTYGNKEEEDVLMLQDELTINFSPLQMTTHGKGGSRSRPSSLALEV